MADRDADKYFAHSGNDQGDWDPLRIHLKDVATRAQIFAQVFQAGDAAYLAGLLHDLGKYGDLFQDRLRGKESGLDHWSVGAGLALERYRSCEVALAVQGHHVGLQWWEREELRKLLTANLERSIRPQRLTEKDPGVLLARLEADGLKLPEGIPTGLSDPKCAAAMLDVRMLFSALVDADYLSTEQHFDREPAQSRVSAAELQAAEAADVLERHLEVVANGSDSSSAVSEIRRDLRGACYAAAEGATGLFTLTAPTGAGKTLSTLAFALRHARRNRLRRIVVVMPFLSIIDQTVRVYREALAEMEKGGPGDRYILEHHSLALEEAEGQVEGRRLRGMLAQNWDAPIVITTSVQFLESLFSDSPADCRKLHRLAESVVVFDEVQTLPLKVVVPTLATLSHLSARYRSSVVFSTATQPAFRHLDARVRRHCAMGWSPREIVPSELRLFDRAHRVRVSWPKREERIGWPDLAMEFAQLSQVLCNVNLKRHARDFFHLLQPQWGDGAFHLSTAMCPKHRAAVLQEVRARLGAGARCALVATQCVEAGVDLDFPAVFRALGPLDSIAQAAGRCNRNGKLEAGTLRVFVPEDGGSPPGVYKQATDLTAALLNADGGLSIDDPAAFEQYFRVLYSIARVEDPGLLEFIQARDFREVRKRYRIIDQDSVNVLVAYDREKYEDLAKEARNKGLSRNWVARARLYAVSCYRRDAGAMEPVPMKDRSESGDWYLYERNYDFRTGLEVPQELEFLGA